jgi:hypothetical protein
MIGGLEIASGEGDIRDEAAAPTLRPGRRAAMVRRVLAQGSELAEIRLFAPEPISEDGFGIGAWPSGKATGFGPVILGSNPSAPATLSTCYRTILCRSGTG